MVMQPTNVVTRNDEAGPPGPDAAAPPDPSDAGDRAAALREEMVAAWKRGERPLAEEFLVRLPFLRNHSDAAVQLIHQEVRLRQEFGEPLASLAVVRRFPQWQAEIEALLERDRPSAPPSAPPVFPEVGESLGDFHLLAELGQGALGRVFLANQPALADRPVVLKLTPCHGREHLSLARLQHTHVVPLYWVQDYPARNLRVLCMPYLGGSSLLVLLERLQRQPLAERTGQHLLDALDQAQAESPLAPSTAGPARPLLARASYAQAVCWIGACLAEALQYAHERALVHLDLKSSNVLLAADGQPMLLDFHLAREPLRAGDPAPDWLGGTPLYMSPEQKAALAAVRNQGTLPAGVDGRSDVYSLGMLLYEVLANRLPVANPLPLHRVNPQVSAGLSDIIHRCLEPDPQARYRDAAALALDLRLHLSDQPLRGVRNRSWCERWGKWRRRRPQALALWALILAAGVALLTVGILVRGHRNHFRQQAEAALLEGRHQVASGEYTEAARTLTRGLALAEGLSGGDELRRSMGEQLRLARRALAARDLHTVAERARFLVDLESLPRGEGRGLESRCRSVWDTRRLILERAGAELPAETEQRIQTDLLDLTVVWADLSVGLAPAAGEAKARREAFQVLEEAEALIGPSAVLYRERQAHAAQLGLSEAAEAADRAAAQHPPRTPWDHYALGRFLLRGNDLTGAAAQFDEAVRLQPQGFWPNFYQGVCAYRLGKYDEARTAFSVCIALAPNQAAGYFNRARAWEGQGSRKNALRDYDEALRLQPTLSAAWLNRGILQYRAQRYAEARVDLQRALDHGADPAAAYYNLALVHLAEKDRAAALTKLREALRHNPDYQPARELRDRLQ